MSATTQTAFSRFIADSNAKAFDKTHRKTIRHNMGKYDTAVEIGLHQFSNHSLAKERASFFKAKAIHHLPELLEQFEENITKNGATVLWARDAKEALKLVTDIMDERMATSVVKSKSMTTEELDLNEYFEHKGLEAIETDLGEFIVQMAGQKPYHIVTPCMHMSKADIAKLFHEKLNIPLTDNAEELVAVARHILREKYTTADVGITGANFLIADTGSIAITENEGNARLSVTFPKTHIVIAGIEKVLPHLRHLHTIWPLLATHGTGQQVTVYNTIISGPRRREEYDGPNEMFVVLIDNGRTNLLADPEKREALKCIRCGACLNACPVYRNIGGHSYGTTYQGPIGSVITPHFKGMEEFKHLSYASSLCGACAEVCPVKINLSKLLLLNRMQALESGQVPASERTAIKLWSFAMHHRSLVNFPGASLKNWAAHQLLKETWSKNRTDITFAKQTFTAQWTNRRKHKR